MNFFRRKSTQPSDAAEASASASAKTNQNGSVVDSTTNASSKKEPTVHTRAAGRDTESIAPLIESSEDAPTQSKRRRSSLFKRSPPGEKKKSISDSGPYIFAFDPVSGKEILQKNPHWPYEDSWKREEQRERGETDNVVVPGGLGFGVNNW